jgi:hypothetical protein
VPEHPPGQAMPDFPGERGRGDGQHRAPGMGQAVAAYPAVDHLGQRAMVASAHDQQVTGVGDRDQDPARLAALDRGLDRRVCGDLAPRGGERLVQPLSAPSAQTRRR